MLHGKWEKALSVSIIIFFEPWNRKQWLSLNAFMYLLKSSLVYWLFIACPPCLKYWCKKISFNKQKFSPPYWFNPSSSFIKYVRVCLYSFVKHLFNLKHNYNYLLIMKFIPDPAPLIIFFSLCCFCFIVPSIIHSFVLFFLYVYNCFKHWKAIVEDKEKKNQYSKFKVFLLLWKKHVYQNCDRKRNTIF